MPAIAVTHFLTGSTPTSAELDNRASFCRTQYAYYVAQQVAEPKLGPYEALGKAFAAESFFATYRAGLGSTPWHGPYNYALGVNPGQAQVDHFNNQYNYFYNLYINAGQNATTADLWAVGAVTGQILGYGALLESDIIDVKGETWGANAANGSPAYSSSTF